MAKEIAHINETWYLKARNVVIASVVVDGDTEDVAITYATTFNGVPYVSGTMVWELDGIAGQWVAKFALPPTPGILTGKVTATLTGDLPGRGTNQQSIRVIA